MNYLKMRLKEAFLLSFLLYPVFCKSQNLPNVIPPSPQTREINKYIDFPVNLSAGVSEISIPLYTIKTKGIEIPITLNYHASGIKNSQDDGDVGVGWSLSSNYRISRTIYGFADTKDISMTPAAYPTNISTLTTLNLDKYLSRFVSDYPGSLNTDTHLPARSGGLLDGEYDHFYFIIPNQAGKFIISDRINKTVSEFYPNNNKYTYIEGIAASGLASGIIGLSIKDADQNRYSFGEQASNLGAKVLETHNGALNQKDVTAWALTDIDTKYGEKIKFSYTKKDITTKNALQATLTVSEPRPSTDDVWEYNMDDLSQNSNYSAFSVSSITTQSERVSIVNEDGSTYSPKKIKQINVIDSLTGNVLRRIEFYYSDTIVFPSGYSFLDSVKVFGKDLLTFEKYSFDYYERDIPSTSNIVPDQWGYNKYETSRSKLLHQEFGSDVGLPPGSDWTVPRTGTLYTNSGYGGYFSDRKSNANPHFFSLKTISYPTGGKTLFEYEPNKIANNYSGGIRIKSIKKFISLEKYNTNDAELSRYFTYGLNNSGNGYSNYYLGQNDFKREHVSYKDYLGAMLPRKKTTYSSKSLSESNQITYYQHVTETELNNGKTTYFFSAVSPSSVNAYPVTINSNNIYLGFYSVGPKYVADYSEWQKPNLLKMEYFDNANTLLKRQTYSFAVKPGQYFVALKVRPFASFEGVFNDSYMNYFSPSLDLSSMNNHGLYSITTAKDLLSEQSDVTYFGSDSLKVTTAYLYNNIDQVIKESSVNSKAQVIEKTLIYPSDTPFDYISSRMIQANDLNKILEETIKVSSNIVSQLRNQYIELPGDIFVPAKITSYNTISQLHQEDIIFHKYDAKGNVLSLSKPSGVVTNYIWSYGSQLPVAEIRNVDYSVIESVLGNVQITAFSNLSAPDKATIDSFLQPLKTAVPDAFVASYVYKPLVGISSETDIKGLTAYYEYDSFGRLEFVKDNNGNIKRSYKYQYRP